MTNVRMHTVTIPHYKANAFPNSLVPRLYPKIGWGLGTRLLPKVHASWVNPPHNNTPYKANAFPNSLVPRLCPKIGWGLGTRLLLKVHASWVNPPHNCHPPGHH